MVSSIKTIFFVLIVSTVCYAVYVKTDSLIGNSGRLQVNDTLLLKKAPLATNPIAVLVRDSTDSNKVKQWPIDSLGGSTPDSVRASHESDHADSADRAATADLLSSYNNFIIASANSGYSHDFACAEYGNNTFIALANSGATGGWVSVSNDGVRWWNANAAENTGWIDVCFGEGLFIAIAPAGTNRTMISYNGISWTSIPFYSPTSEQPKAICYGNGKFVVVPSSGDSAYYSTSGRTWYARSAKSGGWSDVDFGAGNYVAVGASSGTYKIMYSSDALTWYDATAPTGANFACVKFCFGRFVAVEIFATVAYIDTSKTGVNWSRSDTLNTPGGDFTRLVYGDGIAFLCRTTNESGEDSVTSIYKSTNGYQFEPVIVPNPNGGGLSSDWYGAAFGDGVFVFTAGYQSVYSKEIMYTGKKRTIESVDAKAFLKSSSIDINDSLFYRNCPIASSDTVLNINAGVIKKQTVKSLVPDSAAKSGDANTLDGKHESEIDGDSARVAGTLIGAWWTFRGDTVVVHKTATDSLCLKAVAP